MSFLQPAILLAVFADRPVPDTTVTLYGVVADDAEEKQTIAKLPSTVTVPIEEDEIHDFVIEEQHLKFFDKETGLKTAPQPLSA